MPDFDARGLRLLEVGDDYFHRTDSGWTWDLYFPLSRALECFERHVRVDEYLCWGRIAQAASGTSDTKFPFPNSPVIRPIGARTSGSRGLWSHVVALMQLLTRGVRAVCRADVVLFRWPSVHSMILLPVALISRKTVVVRLRVDVETGLREARAIRSVLLARLAGAYTRWALRRASVPVCISSFLKAKYGGPRTVVLNDGGVMLNDVVGRTSHRPWGSDGATILYVGRLTPEKGVDTLLRALALLDRSVRLRIVGAGPERNTFERLAAVLGISERAEFIGAVIDRAELTREYREADVFVLPSRSEGFGYVLLEAMATGTPIVATAVGAIPDLIRDGWNGVLVSKDDPVSLAAAFKRMLVDPELRSFCAEHGVETVRQYVFERQTERWIELTVAEVERRTGRRFGILAGQ